MERIESRVTNLDRGLDRRTFSRWYGLLREPRLLAYVALGGLVGASYVLFDVLSEGRIRTGTLGGTLAEAHALIDRVVPVVIGGLLGVCAHYFRLRARLSAAEEAAARAEMLRSRLQKVERDQAVWVVAAAVLHELNNPLHALGLLLDELCAREGADRGCADLVERARSQAERALSSLTMLKSLRATGEPEFQRIALQRLVCMLADDIGSLAAEDGLIVRTECKEPVLAHADPRYVRTILENLLDNSLSSLRDHRCGCITIRLAAEAGRAVVRVCDDGPPLDAEVRAALFEPLRTTKNHGLGLGLPIARALARAMRGELTVDGVDGKAFRLELPLSAAS
jgi:signal transduction histidine kinase